MSHVLLETTTGLVNSGNSLIHTLTTYEGYMRHAILHSSGRGLEEGFTKILTEQADGNIIVVPNVSVV